MYSDACLYRLAEGGSRALLFALVSESVVRISKFAKMTKFLFLALGHVWVGKKVCAKLKSTSRRGGGVLYCSRTGPYSSPRVKCLLKASSSSPSQASNRM